MEKNQIPLNTIEYKLLNYYPEDDDKTTNIYLSSFSEELEPVVKKIVNEANKKQTAYERITYMNEKLNKIIQL